MFYRLLVLLGLSLVLAPGAASAADPFKVVAFAGSSNLPLWIGQTQGFFGKRGIDVTIDITPNSVEMARNLEAGRYDLALSSIDNIVAYDEGQGEAGGLGRVDFVSLFGVDDGMLSLVVAPSVASIKAIEGKTVAVDAATTGFAFVARAILSKSGVTHYEFTKFGGGAQRLQALLDGKTNVTLLNTPLDIIAEAHGFKSLQRATDVIGPYQGISAVVKRVRVNQDRAHLVAFTKGFHDSLRWMLDPANKAAAVNLLQTRMKMAPADAQRAYAAITDKKHGIFRDMRVSMRGLGTVLALRQRYAQPQVKLHPAAYYVDESIRRAAFAGK